MPTLLTLVLVPALLAAVGYVIYRAFVSPALRAVFVRNVSAYFSGVLGYLFIVAFVVAASLLAFSPRFFTDNAATLDQLSAGFPVLLLFLIPAITMTAWADERKLGTDELLFTLPAREVDVLLGKYLAVLAVYSIALAFSLTNLVVLAAIGDPDWGPIFTTYLGYLLVGAALLAAGLFCSSLTNSPTVAFVLGVVVCAIPVFIGEAPRTLFGFIDLPRESLLALSVPEQFRDFTLGVVPLSGVLYFLSLAAFFLYLNHVLIRRRLWAGRRASMGWQYAVRAASLAVALFALNVLATQTTARADFTERDLYTLSPVTTGVLDAVPEDRPVTVQAFLSEEVPAEYVDVRKRIVGLLRRFDNLGGGAVTVRTVEVEPFSEEAEEARSLGIEPREVVTTRDGRSVTEEVFLGVVFTSPTDEVVVSSVGPGSLVEYELTRSLRTVAGEERLTVGVLETDAGLMGGGAATGGGRDWAIVRELELQYEVVSVSPDGPIDAAKYDVLLAVMPSSLTEPQMGNFLAHVESGSPVLIFDDPYPFTLNPSGRVSTAPRLPKPSPGGMFGMMNRQPPEPKADGGRLTRVTDALGIRWQFDRVVFEAYNPHPEFGELVPDEYLFVTNRPEAADALNPDSPITEGLGEILFAYSGEVGPADGAGDGFTPLCRTGESLSGTMDWADFTEPSFDPFGGGESYALNPRPERRVDPGAHVLAARITGGGDGEADGTKRNAVFVADIDLISDWFFQQRFQAESLSFDNVAFVLNAVDVLAGTEEFLPLRRRKAQRRTLTEVESQTTRFLESLNEAERDLEKTLDEKLEQRRLTFEERRRAIEEDPNLSPRARAQAVQAALADEQRRMEIEEARERTALNRELDLKRSATRRRVRETENKFRLYGVTLPPIPAIALGLVVLLIRLAQERRELDPDRAV